MTRNRSHLLREGQSRTPRSAQRQTIQEPNLAPQRLQCQGGHGQRGTVRRVTGDQGPGTTDSNRLHQVRHRRQMRKLGHQALAHESADHRARRGGGISRPLRRLLQIVQQALGEGGIGHVVHFLQR